MGSRGKKQKQEFDENGWSRWYVVNEAGTPQIKRYRTMESGKRTWQRYPAKEYRLMEDPELESLLRRINATYESERQLAAERYNFDHAYINLASISAFEKRLRGKTTDESHVKSTIHILNTYVLAFFVLQKRLADPSKWHMKEDEWGVWLLSTQLKATTIKRIVGTANRFTKFLVQKMYPEMAAVRKLEPIGKTKLDQHASQLADGRTKYITAETFKAILAHAEKKAPEIVPNMKLCYYFGLRISETLGLTKDKFLKDSLLVDEQGDRLDEAGEMLRKKTKTRASKRRVPYWNISAKEAWSLVQQVQPMHPDTLIKWVNECLASFGHKSHDFRRTFITNSFRKAPHWKDVMKAAGHTDVRTTMQYDQDDRQLSEEKADLD